VNNAVFATAPKTPVAITWLQDAITETASLQLGIARFDQWDDILGGNKLFKIKHRLCYYGSLPPEARPMIISFGGCYSNWIAALAQAAAMAGVETYGIIRGEPVQNITLQRAICQGMKIFFVPRKIFADKQRALNQVLPSLPENRQKVVIPMGGADQEGFYGCREIGRHLPAGYDYLLCPTATGTTLAALTSIAPQTVHCAGIAVLKNKEEQLNTIRCFFRRAGLKVPLPEIVDEYHEGGFARTSPRLLHFLHWFQQSHPDVPVEPVFTGKMLFGIYQLIQNGFFKKGSRLLAIHTGGLQYLPYNHMDTFTNLALEDNG
jgi:1-aminocyclopropane-1-carboxylate deaminase